MELEQAIAAVRALRGELLFGDVERISELCGVAEQHYLCAVAHLEIAERELTKAKLWQTTALSGRTPS